MEDKILLVGTGNMAKEYTKVLIELKQEFITIGNSLTGVEFYKKETRHEAFANRIKTNLNLIQGLKTAIVAVNVPNLASVCKELIELEFHRILLEKPGGINVSEIRELKKIAEEKNVDVLIAYNRRFYTSVQKVKELIVKDQGITSFSFEFTEWIDKIGEMNKDPKELEAWMLENSSHVIDLAFFIGGKPEELSAYTSGSISWHSPAIFSGSGKSDKGALFSYHANWDAPGRWGVEFLTKNYRFILRPLEKLMIQKRNEILINQYELGDDIDKKYKPGLLKQVEAFLKGNDGDFATIKDQLELAQICEKIKRGVRCE